ncbi:MAG: hypothetical protein ACLRM9_04985 [Collinsella aerofaciens]
MTAWHFSLDENGKVRRGEEQVISESNRRGHYLRHIYLLALPDVDNDSVKITYKDRYKVYTNPRVLAVLQDAPYVEDLEQAYGYLVLGGTSYGEEKGTGHPRAIPLAPSWALPSRCRPVRPWSR